MIKLSSRRQSSTRIGSLSVILSQNMALRLETTNKLTLTQVIQFYLMQKLRTKETNQNFTANL